MIVSTWTGAQVQALRKAALRLTQQQFGDRLGFQEPTIRKWERATEQRPVRGTSAEALDTQLARLDDTQRARFRAALDRVAVMPAVRPEEQGEDELRRREFGMVIGAALVAPRTPVSRLGIGDAHRLAEQAADLTSRDQVIGGVTLVRQAVAHLEAAKDALEMSSFDERAGRAFMSAAGELATITGWMAYDADLPDLARRCYADAFALAGQAGDDTLTTHVCLNATHMALYMSRLGKGNPHRALGLIGRARDLTRGRPPGRVHALMAAREAQAYATLGDRPAFDRAVATAWRELDFALAHEPLDECPAWLRFVNSTEVRCHESRGYGDLGDLDTAVDIAAGLALDHVGERNASNYRAGWAFALARAGDVEGARTQGHLVMDDLEGTVSSTRTLRLLEPVREAGDDHDEFSDRYDRLATV